jgi:hypothetical protein
MTSSCVRFLVLCLFAGAFSGLTGCKSDGVKASSAASGPISGPPTYNQRFAARNPRVCATVTTPPTSEQAKALVQCSSESATDGMDPVLTLVSDLQVQMGQATRYNPQVTHSTDVDPNSMTYPIRGQGTKWLCTPIAGSGGVHPAGENCQVNAAAPGGKGECYRTTFGDWHCDMTTGGGAWDNRRKGPTDY